MKIFICLLFLAGFLSAGPLELKDGDRVTFVGGTFVERETEYSLIETYLTLANPDKDIKFRNLGWSADTVKGESRGYFKVKEGYGLLLQKVGETKPTVIVLTYGANAAREGLAHLPAFIEDYTRLINDLKKRTGARIILMSTPPQENLGEPYPNPEKYNKALGSYFWDISKLAKKLELVNVNIFNIFKEATGYTTNSIHLNESGYSDVATYLAELNQTPDSMIEIDISKENPRSLGGELTSVKETADKVTFTFLPDSLAPFSSKRKLRVRGLNPGVYELKVGDRVILSATAEELNRGVDSKYLLVQERLLQIEITEKNEQFFHSWRPQNTIYLFGNRKHEQGQNGKEIGEFGAYIKKHEAKITKLKKLKELTWEIYPKKKIIPKPAVVAKSLILPPEEEVKTFNLPADLQVSLFAAEPMIINPTNMNWDSQGRLWVACAPGYPQIKPGHMANDQIIVLEDTNKDGIADKRHVFVDNVLIPTAVLPGNGGVYVGNSTEFVFYQDTDGDMKADVKKIIMSGFGTEDTHHIIHTPYWGQDGMLYFNQSIYTHSHVETPWGVERLMAGGIWQYNPHTERLKVFSRGLLNTWGHRMDKYGQSFATDGAGSHGINYIFPGVAQRTAHGTRHLYPGLNPGQPKHCGLEIISGSHFPEKYQDLLIANDFRGHRTNSFKLSENGSAFISSQQMDIISTGSGKIDRKGQGGGFRPVDLKMGPDGALYVADWSNIIIQHGEVDFRDSRRDQIHGRIWRITAKGRPLTKIVQFREAPLKQLLGNLTSADRYLTDMSKRELIERGATKVPPALDEWLAQGQSDYSKLQALWLRVGLNAPDVQLLKDVLQADDGNIRAAAVRVAAQQYDKKTNLLSLFKNTIKDSKAIVRLETVNALRVLKTTTAVEVALQALDSKVDKTIDYALQLTVRELADQWIGRTIFNGNIKHLSYAVSASHNPKALKSLYDAYKAGKIAKESQAGALKLIGELGNVAQLTELYQLLFDGKTSQQDRVVILDSLLKTAQARGLRPKTNFAKLATLIGNPVYKQQVTALIGAWKLKGLVARLASAAMKGESSALAVLAQVKGPQAEKIIMSVIEQNKNNNIAVKATAALAGINMTAAVDYSLKLFAEASATVDYGPIFEAIYKDKKGPSVLDAALQGKKINPSVALLGVQRANIGGRDLSQLINSLNKAGDLKPMKQILSAEELAALVKAVNEKGNPQLGENIYRKQSIACMTCHAIGGAGTKIGPDLISIGASAPVDYLIESILQPSKKIKEGYHMTMVMTKDGQMIAGSELSASKEEVVIRNALGVVQKIPARNIKKKEVNPMSMMPPGLAASLSEEEFIHLISFMSQLGKSGDFKMSSQRYVRTFGIADNISKENLQNLESVIFRTGYAKVNGLIPMKDKSLFSTSTPALKFDLEVIKGGLLTLQFSYINGLRASNFSNEIFYLDREKKTAKLKVNKGDSSVLICLNRNFKAQNLTIKILDSETNAVVKFK